MGEDVYIQQFEAQIGVYSKGWERISGLLFYGFPSEETMQIFHPCNHYLYFEAVDLIRVNGKMQCQCHDSGK
jgi:hypothetical protein